MEVATRLAIEQLDTVIAYFAEAKGGGAEDTSRFISRARAAIVRLTPKNSVYRAEIATTNQYSLLGIVKALRDDYAAGYLKTLRQVINADLFSDFLSMADYLMQDEHLKQPAAVIAGGVLEEHIRKLCEANGISTVLPATGRPLKLDVLNAELAKADVYSKNEQKQITAWCGIRNSAAHARYDEFDEHQVHAMIDGIRGFVGRYPA